MISVLLFGSWTLRAQWVGIAMLDHICWLGSLTHNWQHLLLAAHADNNMKAGSTSNNSTQSSFEMAMHCYHQWITYIRLAHNVADLSIYLAFPAMFLHRRYLVCLDTAGAATQV